MYIKLYIIYLIYLFTIIIIVHLLQIPTGQNGQNFFWIQDFLFFFINLAFYLLHKHSIKHLFFITTCFYVFFHRAKHLINNYQILPTVSFLLSLSLASVVCVVSGKFSVVAVFLYPIQLGVSTLQYLSWRQRSHLLSKIPVSPKHKCQAIDLFSSLSLGPSSYVSVCVVFYFCLLSLTWTRI